MKYVYSMEQEIDGEERTMRETCSDDIDQNDNSRGRPIRFAAPGEISANLRMQIVDKRQSTGAERSAGH